MLLDGGAMVEWGGEFFDNCHRQFVKEWPAWRHHRPQWCIYMADIWPSSIDNTAGI
jgi:hypothetical protein